jgi:ribonucleotide reductase alpha subunit
VPVTFSQLLDDETFKVRNRRDLKRFYDEVKLAVRESDLALEGHTLPTTMNAFIERVEGKKDALTRDYDVVDFSLASNGKLKRWRDRYLLRDKQVVTTAEARELFERIKELSAASDRSMKSTNGKKDDLLTALSDLQAAAALTVQTYDNIREAFKLPDRALEIEQVKVRGKGRKGKKGGEEGSA